MTEKQKVLIVDDVPNNITVLTEILKSDYKLICATNGNDALKIMTSSIPDIILLDIMMPDMDGYEVCRQIKLNDRTKNIPVIYLTAKNEEADENKGLETGAVDYISKPFSPTILKHKVRIHTELKRHRDNLEEIVKERTLEITQSNEKLQQEMKDRILAQEGLAEQRAYFQQLFENSPLAILLLKVDGKIIEVNKSFETLFGYDVEGIKGEYNKHIVVPEDLVSENETCLQIILSGKTISRDTFRAHKNGNLIPVSFLGYPILVKDKIEGLFIVYEDISQRKNFEAQLLHQTFHDSLTRIPNRVLLMERLERALERTKRYESYAFAVMMIDLDGFKRINDSLGHLAGDKLLVEISKRFQESIRSSDTIARMGGDEFAILVEEFHDKKEVFAIAKRLHQVAQYPLVIERNEVSISASIGIVVETKAYRRADYLLRDADIAMYRAKESGRAQFKVFNKKMHKEAVESLRVENDLRNGLNNGEFILHYQPILSLVDQQLIGFEALIRWNHPIRGMIEPKKFIPIAEDTGLIIPLGQMVIKEACKQLKEWYRLYPKSEGLSVSVNISVKQFMQSDLTDFIAKVLSEYQLPADRLKIEITESLLVRQANLIVDKLSHMKKLGLKVALDDFGTGYSSLSYIQQFPIDNIKIDRSFISEIDVKDASKEIVKTIIDLSRTLSLDVVAEGVERETQIEMLKQLQCDNAQGFYFSEPVDNKVALEIIKQYL